MKNKEKKIIHILHHPPLSYHLNSSPEELKQKIGGYYLKVDEPISWVGFWEDFHVKTALETAEQTDEYQIECWRPYSIKLQKIYSYQQKTIKHFVFPYKEVRVFNLFKFIYSKEIFNQILEEQKKYDLIIHFHDGHSFFVANLINKIMKFKIKIVYQHRSNKFALWHYRELHGIQRLNFFILFTYFKQVKSLKGINLYLTDSKPERLFLKQALKYNSVKYFKQGINFDDFDPKRNNRLILRLKYCIPAEDIVILYVGRFNADKDFDVLVNTFIELKQKYSNLTFIGLGGYKTDPFYNEAFKNGVKLFERMPESLISEFYCLADIYVMPTFNATTTLFGGIGNAPIQAMACNLRVVSNNLIHFPGESFERKLVGSTIGAKDNIVNILNKEILLIRDVPSKNDIRSIAEKYYSSKKNISNLIKIYQELN